jgi:hypothetical protein
MFAAISYLPAYLQIVTGVSATTSGLPAAANRWPDGHLRRLQQAPARTGHHKALPNAATALAGAGLYLLPAVHDGAPETRTWSPACTWCWT